MYDRAKYKNNETCAILHMLKNFLFVSSIRIKSKKGDNAFPKLFF